MCGLAALAIGMTVAGGAADAYTQHQIGKANSAMSRAQAAQTAEIGRFNEARARDRMDRLIGRQRGELAARGVDGGAGSAEALGADAAGERAIEAQAQRFNTSSQVSALSNEARLHDYRGRVGAMNGVFRTGATTLTRSLDLWPELAGT